MDAGVLIGQRPRKEVAKVLEHVLSEEGSVGSHHPRHRVEDREEGLEGLHALRHTLFTLKVCGKGGRRERERDREGGREGGRKKEEQEQRLRCKIIFL